MESVSSKGHVLIPLVKLIERSQVLVGEVIIEPGISPPEAVLAMLAAQVAGPPHPSK